MAVHRTRALAPNYLVKGPKWGSRPTLGDLPRRLRREFLIPLPQSPTRRSRLSERSLPLRSGTARLLPVLVPDRWPMHRKAGSEQRQHGPAEYLLAETPTPPLLARSLCISFRRLGPMLAHPVPADPFQGVVEGRARDLEVRHTADLLEPLSSAATICSTVSGSIAGGRPPLRPRRRAATSPAFTRSRIRDRSYWASVPKRL